MKKINNKILVIGGSFPLPLTGGSVQYIYNLLSNLRNYSVYVLTGSCTNENVEFDKKSSFNIIRTRYIRQVLDPKHRNIIRRSIDIFLSNVLVLIQYYKLKPQIIYLTDYSLLSLSLLLIKKCFSTRIVIFTYAEEITQYSKNKIHRSFFKSIFKNFDAIITVSDYTFSVIKSIYPVSQNKVLKIIPSISPNKTKTNFSIIQEVKNSLQIDSNDFVLLTVGRLEERKGHLFVLKAIKEIIANGCKVKYIIIGDGPMKKTIQEKITQLELEPFVSLFGRVHDSVLSASYKIANLFIMPNIELSNGDTEGCPTVFLEAGFHGLPSIGGNAGGVSDAILDKETGYIIDPQNNGVMVELLENMIKDSELRIKLGKHAKLYAENFSAEKQAKLLMNLNNTLISN